MIIKQRGRVCCLTIFAVAVLASANLVMAHHSFSMFDTTKSVTLSGVVSKFEWTNPHVIIEIDVQQKTGLELWTIELGSPSILQQGGWKFKDIKHGDKVTVVVSPLKSQGHGGLLVQVTLPDGRVLGNGPGRGPAAPTAPAAPAR